MNYQIVYKKGVDNTSADALSRKPQPQVFHIFRAQPVWLEEIVNNYAHDDKITEILQQMSMDPAAKPNYQLVHGLLRYKGCIWIGNNLELQHKIFSAFHDSPVGGHSGFPVTYNRIHSLFRWAGMKAFIRNKVQSCMVCQQAKA